MTKYRLFWLFIVLPATVSCVALGAPLVELKSPAAPTITWVTPHQSECTVRWSPVPKAENFTLCYYEKNNSRKMQCEDLKASNNMHTIKHLSTGIVYTLQLHASGPFGDSDVSHETCSPGALSNFKLKSRWPSCWLLWNKQIFGAVSICFVNQTGNHCIGSNKQGYLKIKHSETGKTRVLSTTAYDHWNGTRLLKHDFYCASEARDPNVKSRNVRQANIPWESETVESIEEPNDDVPIPEDVKVKAKWERCDLSWAVNYDVETTTVCYIQGEELRRGQNKNDRRCTTVLTGHHLRTRVLKPGEDVNITLYSNNQLGRSHNVYVTCTPNGNLVTVALIGGLTSVFFCFTMAIVFGVLIHHYKMCPHLWSPKSKLPKSNVPEQNLPKPNLPKSNPPKPKMPKMPKPKLPKMFKKKDDKKPIIF